MLGSQQGWGRMQGHLVPGGEQLNYFLFPEYSPSPMVKRLLSKQVKNVYNKQIFLLQLVPSSNTLNSSKFHVRKNVFILRTIEKLKKCLKPACV